MKLVLVNLVLLIVIVNCISSRKNPNKWIRSGRPGGDMILRRNRNGLIDPIYRWPHKTVCYQFSGNFTQDEINLIYDTVNTAFEGTCIRFRHCDCNGNYVNVTNDQDGCFSEVGYRGGVQQLNLGLHCLFRETIAHEFMHAVGFYHQQSTTNRDNYIKLITENIDPVYLHDFNIPPNITSFGQPYDYCSIMHYDIYAFTLNGEPTMELLCSTDCDVGFVLELSQVDKNKINLMYECGPEYPIVYVPDPCTGV
ncbi:hypothetical protein FQR65_LT08227 [Abscondita terminalis]|nr:hypothetical protein FQR65_LT08227 [Abscondita terminalis]